VAPVNATGVAIEPEIFEKYPILFNAKEDENFNHPSTICQTYGAGRHTLSISRIEI
jgi:hypothetical protein